MRRIGRRRLGRVAFQEFDEARDAVLVDIGDAPVTVNRGQVESDRLAVAGVIEVGDGTCRAAGLLDGRDLAIEIAKSWPPRIGS